MLFNSWDSVGRDRDQEKREWTLNHKTGGILAFANVSLHIL